MSRIDATTCVDLRVVQGRQLHVAEVVLEVARVDVSVAARRELVDGGLSSFHRERRTVAAAIVRSRIASNRWVGVCVGDDLSSTRPEDDDVVGCNGIWFAYAATSPHCPSCAQEARVSARARSPGQPCAPRLTLRGDRARKRRRCERALGCRSLAARAALIRWCRRRRPIRPGRAPLRERRG